MNRRNFVLSSSAAFAFIGQGVLAQRSARGSDVLTSELTGGQVDISGTSLELVQQHIDEADGSEHCHFTTENEGTFDIYFWPHAIGDAAQMTEGLANMWVSTIPESEMLGSDQYDDGGYVAFSSTKIGYYEYQRNAYPDHDLILLFYVDADIFEENFAAAQAILIDGMEPFLFQDDSGIIDLAASMIGSSSTGTAQSTSRTTRGSGSEKTEETTNSRGSRSATESSTTGNDDPVDAVAAHRDAFWTSYTEFYDLLEALGAEGATETEIEDTWALILNISLGWQNYPAEAAEIAFSSEYASLEGVYLDWADGVGLMGVTFEQYALNEATIDDVLAANDALVTLDDDLGVELGALGDSTKPNRSAITRTQLTDHVKTLAHRHSLAYR